MPGQLTLGAARRIALAAQGVGRPRPTSVTMRHVQAEIDRVAQFQIDSVNVAVRAHYMPLFTRLGSYDTELLRRASESAPRRLFEYWGHAACLIDVRLHPALRWRMAHYRARRDARLAGILAENPGLYDAILAQIGAHGALTAREVDNKEARDRVHWGWNWSQAKRVLEHLFDTGELSVAGRNTSFERRYDRTDRVLGMSTAELDEQEAHDALVRRAAGALGVADLDALSAYFYLRKDATRAAIIRLEVSGELEPVTVAGLAAPHWLWHQARRPRSWHAQALVSPFDSLAFERGRLERLFGTRYRIEIYVPPAQRSHGYYVYLILLQGRPCCAGRPESGPSSRRPAGAICVAGAPRQRRRDSPRAGVRTACDGWLAGPRRCRGATRRNARR